MRSLKHAFRVLFKSPFVTAVAILSLALGIGANSAIYSLFDQLLLRPLPVPNPGELVNLSAPGPKPGSQSCSQAGGCDVVLSYPMFRDLERKQTVLTGVAAHRGLGVSLLVRDEPMTGDGMLVSGSYFSTLGLRPALGRLLVPSDDEVIGANFVTVLSYGFWATRFGADSSAVGQRITVNGQALTIVGVAPKGFFGTTLGDSPMVFAPISMRAVLSNGFTGFENRRSYWIYAFGRLKPGVTLEQAASGLNAVYHPIVTEIEAPLQQGMSAQNLERFRAKKILVERGQRGQSSIHREAKTPLMLLFAVTAVVLLIACANIANLLLARGAGRAMEMGIRLSLGATRGQVLSQLLIESVLLAVLGGIASLVVAKLTLGFISALLPSDASTTLRFSLQFPVVVFTAGLSVFTGLLFGLFPALHSTRPDLVTVIRSNAGQIAGGRRAARFRATLVTAQIALSMALLVSAGLFLKSLKNVTSIDLGVAVDNVATFAISPERTGYNDARSHVLFARVEEELGAIPGATGVTASLVPLLAGDSWGTSVQVQGFPKGPDVDNNSRYNEVGPNYFSVLGMRIIAGREFTAADAEGTTKVAVINQAFAKKFKLGADAVGKFMSSNDSDSLTMQIIGVVQNAGYSDVKDSVPPVFFTPWRQDAHIGAMYFYVRSGQPPSTLVRAIPPVLKRIDAALPVEDIKTMPQQIRENTFLDRMISTMSATFAALATLLAGIGLYGVLAYTVAQRTREIGVRMALGANARDVRRLVMRQVAWMTGIGGVIGVAAALGLGRAARSLLYGLQGHDPVVFSLAILALTLVAVVAGYIPARRAAQVSPTRALRYE